MKTDKKVTDLDTIALSSRWNYNKYISKNDKINVNKKYIGSLNIKNQLTHDLVISYMKG
ncbi:hypothetical protein JHX96_00835 [Staphylococcus saccharolyticus]|uniref:hypothetical protein n=1 Tax=Staphylococcus saccharolyticus TaxID=33028 RepID=UPI0013EEB7A6|nr:hypothetical protein [Staphylococcus saccharolyticus]MBL7572683.1 hypothetical protein [Staphylococcus saccharolyticus]MBL7584736.1 hypothetical protein [Staphylococcus saccharolyticus]MBL7638299.1 hypothetical protein [Staphylococcus saccharolyticus]QRJ68190.1 hypothetical protein DMB75_009645 [Staphylococcus saccharolyticus]